MNYTKLYVGYETARINFDQRERVETLGLCPVKFKGWSSSFETEQEAIDACIEEGLTYQNLLIIPKIYITSVK